MVEHCRVVIMVLGSTFHGPPCIIGDIRPTEPMQSSSGAAGGAGGLARWPPPRAGPMPAQGTTDDPRAEVKCHNRLNHMKRGHLPTWNGAGARAGATACSCLPPAPLPARRENTCRMGGCHSSGTVLRGVQGHTTRRASLRVKNSARDNRPFEQCRVGRQSEAAQSTIAGPEIELNWCEIFLPAGIERSL